MKKVLIILLSCILVCVQSVLVIGAILNFNFTGYTNVATLMVTNCTTDVHNQINAVLGGSPNIDVIEIPTTNPTLPHVTCVSDCTMSKAINFTLYTTDNDSVTLLSDRQRLEMKVFDKSPTLLKATNNSHYIYAWWFYLDPSLQAGDNFFHIFQIKAVGTGVDDNPLVTFTLTRKNGLHLRLRHNDSATTEYHNMVPISAVVGKWTQAFVQVNFQNGVTPGAATSGSIQVILKDQSDNQLFQGLFYNDMYWNLANFYRPKWGLYRSISTLYRQPGDWELFNNIQIWKK